MTLVMPERWPQFQGALIGLPLQIQDLFRFKN